MKLASVRLHDHPAVVAIIEDGYVDLSTRLSKPCHGVADLLRGGLLDEARSACAGASPDIALDDLDYQPLVAHPAARIFALGVAYRDHQLETGRASQESPSIFMKDRRSLVGHGHALVKPYVSSQYDFEGEIALIIGKAGRHIPEADAMAHVAGYSILMDGSVRDFQKHSVTAGKNFDRSSAFGPWMVTADEIADPGAMQLTTTLNGSLMQSTTFDQLMWTPAAIVHYVSTFTELQPGDVISTGTPAGVGHRRSPQVFMKADDRLEISVSGVGTLSNYVVDESHQRARFDDAADERSASTQ